MSRQFFRLSAFLFVNLSGAGGKIAFSDLVEGPPNVWQIRWCIAEGDPSTSFRFASLRSG